MIDSGFRINSAPADFDAATDLPQGFMDFCFAPQAGLLPNEVMSASLFDVALVAFQAETNRIAHPLSFYIPKSDSAAEALWWRDLFQAIENTKGLPQGHIKCMALVESHPLAYQIEEFI